jgi:phosphoserine phosphatase
MLSEHLREVEDFLKILRDQQKSLEREILLTTGLHKTQAEQRLRLEIKPRLREYEKEYWQILAYESATVAISGSAPEVVVAEIVEQAGQLQTSKQYSDEVLKWL